MSSDESNVVIDRVSTIQLNNEDESINQNSGSIKLQLLVLA